MFKLNHMSPIYFKLLFCRLKINTVKKNSKLVKTKGLSFLCKIYGFFSNYLFLKKIKSFNSYENTTKNI